MLPGNKFIITVALNGGMQQDRDGALVPKQPAELGEAAARCWEAGAALVHVHARGPDGKNSGDTAIYAEIIREIRARCPVLIQTTNGIGIRRDPKTGDFIWPSDEERLGLLNIQPAPDLYGVAAGSADFYHPEGGYLKETPYVNSPEFLKQTIQAVYARGSALEYEVVEASVLHRLLRYAEEGLFDRHRENIWLLHGGGFGAVPPIARNLMFNVEEGLRYFPQAIWGITSTGKEMFPMITLGLSMGCDLVRVGFEDSIYLPDGSVARHNHEMVEAAVKIGALFGMQPASVDEARARFGI
ncbi:3-keto-5-aminohexanoate cleavage protein [Altererythrobacter sp. CC-YST694]|uniref:3-keto-5-aminohexanoate cleavage protein n=1 Tax=Altererythrobacter sp. CC-YST694 TaxID=2755038 RepID=UPI001D0040BB|nr:3-keto-5-aminohexanoate cleavage protein [Altererythrobacter sp. CC-YST694]MCB5425957.1 3-keto-5-aminohexanoate cleavage protein [Altererythrobacter sp. CC-YST694]